MPAMPQDAKVIVVVVAFVAFTLLNGATSASYDFMNCTYCDGFMQTLLHRDDLLQIFEEKSTIADKFFHDIGQENVSNDIKVDFIQFCMDKCFRQGGKGHKDKSLRSKRNVTEDIYKYFAPPFSHKSEDLYEPEVLETAEETEDTGKPFENSRRVYQGYPKRGSSGCECVKEQEESVKRLIQMVEKYTERIIEHFRGMLREEIKNQVMPERQRELPSVGHQQNYFMISVLTANPPNPAVPYVSPTTVPPFQTTPTSYMVEDPVTTHPTSEAKTDLITTEIPQKGTEYTEETTTEITFDLPEANVMRQSDDELPPDCDNKNQDLPPYIPALIQAFRPPYT